MQGIDLILTFIRPYFDLIVILFFPYFEHFLFFCNVLIIFDMFRNLVEKFGMGFGCLVLHACLGASKFKNIIEKLAKSQIPETKLGSLLLVFGHHELLQVQNWSKKQALDSLFWCYFLAGPI